MLIAGFTSALVIPRLAIMAIGLNGWAGVAWVLGLAALPLLMEFGITPALTRELLLLHSRGEVARSDALFVALLRRVTLGATAAVALLAVSVAVVAPVVALRRPSLCVFLAATANVLMLLADLILIRARIKQRVVTANLCRAGYYALYVGAVALLAHISTLTAEVLLFTQCTVAVAYVCIAILASGPLAVDRPKVSVPWRRFLGTAAAEQTARLQSSLLPAFERTVILSAVGPVGLVTYDVALRLSAAVSFIPAAMAGSLGPLYGALQDRRSFQKAHQLVRTVGGMTVLISIAACVVVTTLSISVLPRFFAIQGSPLFPVAAIVSLGTAINVVSAVPVSYLYAAGQARAVVVKNTVDLTLGILAVGLLVVSGDLLIFLVVRNLGYLFGVAFVWWRARDSLKAGPSQVGGLDANGEETSAERSRERGPAA